MFALHDRNPWQPKRLLAGDNNAPMSDPISEQGQQGFGHGSCPFSHANQKNTSVQRKGGPLSIRSLELNN
jgi:hypothetical protein